MKYFKVIIFSLVTQLLLIESVYSKSVTITLYGSGSSCSEWVKDFDSDISKNITDGFLSAWVAGYMTGVNVASVKDNFKKVSVVTVKDFIRGYCIKNPSSDVTVALDNLQLKLSKIN